MPRAPSAQSGPSAVPTVPPGARCLAETHRARVPRAAGTHSQHVPLHPCARSPSRRAAHGRLSSCPCRWHKVGAAVADVCLQVRCARLIARGARWQPNRCVYGPETATPILRAAHARACLSAPCLPSARASRSARSPRFIAGPVEWSAPMLRALGPGGAARPRGGRARALVRLVYSRVYHFACKFLQPGGFCQTRFIIEFCPPRVRLPLDHRTLRVGRQCEN